MTYLTGRIYKIVLCNNLVGRERKRRDGPSVILLSGSSTKAFNAIYVALPVSHFRCTGYVTALPTKY
jgi:hypothetical protein